MKGGQENRSVDRKTKRAIVRRARKILRSRYQRCQGGSCAYSAVAVITAAREHGVPLRLYAGTAFWKAVSDAQDDGVSANRFGYQFTLEEALPIFHQDRLPELHAWAGTEEGVIVDITLPDWPRLAMRTSGMVWSEPKPPDFFWGTAEELPFGAEYRPDPKAALMVFDLLSRE